MAALEALQVVDSVRVVRHGDASQASAFGYEFEIFFDGVGMTVRDNGRGTVRVDAGVREGSQIGDVLRPANPRSAHTPPCVCSRCARA